MFCVLREPQNRPARPPLYRAPHSQPGLWGSFVHAWNGLIHTVVHQRNMKIHLTAAVLVSLVGSGIPLGLAEKVTLIFCVLLVFFAEILNSALEHLVDLATTELDPNARVTKDAAAAGVLVLAIGTVVIFAAILFHNAETIRTSVSEIARQVALGLPLTTCAVVLIAGPPRAAWIDHLVGAVALGLWALIARRTYSSVFSAMTLGLLVVTANAALVRRKQWRKRLSFPSVDPVAG
jgi:diacylglycerol kinase (ATP)